MWWLFEPARMGKISLTVRVLLIELDADLIKND
jgi:hypothetical protein